MLTPSLFRMRYGADIDPRYKTNDDPGAKEPKSILIKEPRRRGLLKFSKSTSFLNIRQHIEPEQSSAPSLGNQKVIRNHHNNKTDIYKSAYLADPPLLASSTASKIKASSARDQLYSLDPKSKPFNTSESLPLSSPNIEKKRPTTENIITDIPSHGLDAFLNDQTRYAETPIANENLVLDDNDLSLLYAPSPQFYSRQDSGLKKSPLSRTSSLLGYRPFYNSPSASHSIESFSSVKNNMRQTPSSNIVDYLFEVLLSTKVFSEKATRTLRSLSTKRKWELLLRENEVNSDFALQDYLKEFGISDFDVSLPPSFHSIAGITSLEEPKVMKLKKTPSEKSARPLSNLTNHHESTLRPPSSELKIDQTVSPSDPQYEMESPDWFLYQIMSNKLSLKNYKKLEVRLNSYRNSFPAQSSWLESFAKIRGEDALAVSLTRINRKSIKSNDEFDKEYLIIKCLRHMINGEKMISSDQSRKEASFAKSSKERVIRSIIYSLITPRISTRILVTEVLVFLVYYENGELLPFILEAMSSLQDLSGDYTRFQPWLSTLESSLNQQSLALLKDKNTDNEKVFIDYFLTTLLLLNSILEYAGSIKLRITIRREYSDSNIVKIFDRLRSLEISRINEEIERYEQYAEEDFTEFFATDEKPIKLKSSGTDLSLDELYHRVKLLVTDIEESDNVENSEVYLKSFFAALLDLKNELKTPSEINSILALLGSIANHLVKGFVEGSDFSSIINSSIQRLTDRLATHDTARRAVIEARLLENKVKDLETNKQNIDSVPSYEKDELVNKLKKENEYHTNRIELLEKEVSFLRNQIKTLERSKQKMVKIYQQNALSPILTSTSPFSSGNNVLNELEAIYKGKKAQMSAQSDMSEKDFSDANDSDLVMLDVKELPESKRNPKVDEMKSLPPSFSTQPSSDLSTNYIIGSEEMNDSEDPNGQYPEASAKTSSSDGVHDHLETSNTLPVLPPPPPPPPPPPSLLLNESKDSTEVVNQSQELCKAPGSNALVSETDDHLKEKSISTPGVRPKNKLKQMHWNKLEDIERTFWKDMEHHKIFEKLNEKGIFDEVEKVFIAKSTPLKFKSKVNDRNNLQKVSFLPRDLAQQFGINLHTYGHIPVEELTLKILHCDKDIIDNINVLEFFNSDKLLDAGQSIIRNLQPYCTDFSKEDSKPVKSPEELERADRLFLELCVNMKHYWRSRSRALLLVQTYEKEYQDLNNKLLLIDTVINDVKNSESLKNVLVIIKSVGNFMNDSTKQAEGFRLDTLQRLKFMKDDSNSMSFLHYVEKIIRNNFSEFGAFVDDLSSLHYVSNLSVFQLENDCNDFEKMVVNVSNSLAKGNLSDSRIFHPEDKILDFVQAPLDKAKIKSERLRAHLGNTVKEYNDLLEYFGDNVYDKTSYDSFFEKITSFVNEFKRAHIENIQKEEEQRAYENKKKDLEENILHFKRNKRSYLENDQSDLSSEDDDILKGNDRDSSSIRSKKSDRVALSLGSSLGSAVIDDLIEKLKSSAPSSSSSLKSRRSIYRQKALSFYSTDEYFNSESFDDVEVDNDYEKVNTLKRRMTTRKKNNEISSPLLNKPDETMIRAHSMLRKLRLE